MRGCVGAWVRGCVGAWVRGCVGAWVRGCVRACVHVCVRVLDVFHVHHPVARLSTSRVSRLSSVVCVWATNQNFVS